MKLFKNRCYNGGTKHNFQPRYSEKDRSDITKLKGQFEDWNSGVILWEDYYN